MRLERLSILNGKLPFGSTVFCVHLPQARSLNSLETYFLNFLFH